MTQPTTRSGPWWHYGHVWMIFAGPALVIVAALVTAWIAVRSADPVIDEDYYRHGLEINKLLPHQKALLPAVQGRNHSAGTAPAVSR